MQFRNIAVMTGTRAEYGLMSWLIAELAHSERFELQLVVSGSHLSAHFGRTADAITADGITIAAEVQCVGDNDSLTGMVADFSTASAGFGNAFSKLKPDLLVLLGDRYEALAAACAATMLRIPIAHIHGGEITTGAMDDAFRHAITKMAHLHFPAAETYAKRIVQMGEDPAHVHNVGAIGLDSFKRFELLSREALATELDIDSAKPWILVTFHPATLEDADAAEQTRTLISAIDRFKDKAVFLVTKANADPGGRAVNSVWDEYSKSNPSHIKLHKSLGQIKYLSAMKHAIAAVGNSSSGIIEAPAAGIATINIGTRQNGRLMADTILQTDVDEAAIVAALGKILAGEKIGGEQPPPYGDSADATGKILNVLSADHPSLLVKRFHDQQ